MGYGPSGQGSRVAELEVVGEVPTTARNGKAKLRLGAILSLTQDPRILQMVPSMLRVGLLISVHQS